MLVAKGSLFLGRMTELADGMSVLLEPGKGVRMPVEATAETFNELTGEGACSSTSGGRAASRASR